MDLKPALKKDAFKKSYEGLNPSWLVLREHCNCYVCGLNRNVVQLSMSLLYTSAFNTLYRMNKTTYLIAVI